MCRSAASLRTADRMPGFTKLGPLFGIAWLASYLRTEIGTAGVIPCSDLPETSNNIAISRFMATSSSFLTHGALIERRSTP